MNLQSNAKEAPAVAAPEAPPEPASPYPGLRPFQPDDAEYFFGRDEAVRDVVARLRSERFVAVIGGSGCGKSSLVLAGAIPRLRSFAIEEAGDFWVPVYCTPGTNHVGNDTPLRRFARKFCAVLRPPEGETEEERIKHCVAMLRTQGGFALLLQAYGGHVRDADGVDPANLKVNYLFLIDQFEEIFHRSNADAQVAADCEHLVARIVEHAKGRERHGQVCVAITMRSEHLNDCPRYEELPDAINRAFYLVKRLGLDQIEQVIRQPALRYLRRRVAAHRQMQRMGRAQPVEWPDGIAFDAALIKRLRRDVEAILDEPDHADQLPLLQHVLFWIWAAACQRCAGQPVPDGLDMRDLAAALRTAAETPPEKVPSEVNVLKECLERRCNAIFAADPERQRAWESMFRRLAFREPNSGTYTQQRASMARLSDVQGLPHEQRYEALRRFVEPWLLPHRYLHWDVESQSVKVAHEAFIRRWSRFRHWVDEDDRQFRLYVRLLDECREWAEKPEGEKGVHLASGNGLLLYQNARLDDALKDPERQGQLQALLELNRESVRLRPYTSVAARFLRQSRVEEEKQREREQREALEHRNEKERARRIRIQALAAVAALGAVGLTYIALSQVSHKEVTLHRSYALAAETQANLQPQFGDYDQPQVALRSNVQSLAYFMKGRGLRTSVAEPLSAVGFLSNRVHGLRNAELLAEVRATNSVRGTLTGAAWPVAGGDKGATPPHSVLCPELGGNLAAARLFTTGPDERSGLVLALSSAGMSVHKASLLPDGRCSIAPQPLLQTPEDAVKGMGIDRSLRNLVVASRGYTQFYLLDWTDPQNPHQEMRAGVAQDLDLRGLRGIPTALQPFAQDLVVGGQRLRLFDARPGRLTADEVRGERMRLADATNASTCGDLVPDKATTKAFALEPGPGEPRQLCLLVHTLTGPRTEHIAELFAFEDAEAAREGTRRLPLLENLRLGPELPQEFRIDRQSGVLAFQNAAGQWRGTLWSAAGWQRAALAVYQPDTARKYPPDKAVEVRRLYDLLMNGPGPGASDTPPQ